MDVRSGKDYKHLQEGYIPVYGTGGYMLSVNETLSYEEDAIGIGRKGTIDKPYILKAPFWTVDTLFYAVPEDKFDLNFVFDIFQNIDWKKKDESTGVPSLSKTAINDVDILAPSETEQRLIGSYFSGIDHLIALHQRKCNKPRRCAHVDEYSKYRPLPLLLLAVDKGLQRRCCPEGYNGQVSHDSQVGGTSRPIASPV
ncbi:MAG: restriction endonuclease subunit S [Clostridiales bacterium]|nr:restriction endonuclease subunit S [Clostridiales bacterium]